MLAILKNIIFFTYLILWIFPVSAQEKTVQPWPKTSIAVVNSDFLQNESKVGKSLLEQVKKMRAGFVEEVNALQKTFREKRSALLKQQAILSKDAHGKQQQELQKEFNQLEKEFNDRKKNIDDNITNIRAQIRQKIAQIIAQVMKVNKIDMVIDNSARRDTIIAVRDTIDITKNVMVILDEQLPQVEFIPPKKQQKSTENNNASSQQKKD